MKQTAVEWLVSKTELNYYSDSDTLLAIQQALEMEKQQIMEAWHNGKINEQDFFSDHTGTIVRANCAEKYYNETFKKNNL